MSITAQLLGAHRLAVSPSVHIFCEGPRLLVNAGENVQRYHLEKKLHIHRISDIFLTSLSPHATAGLVGLLLSLEGTGASSVTLWGPHGVKALLQLAKNSFAGLHNLEINYRLVGPPDAPPSLWGDRYCTDGVCNGGCRRRSSIGSSSSNSSNSSSSNNKNKGPRTCACSYGPSVKGTASGVPVEAFFLPHSSRQQQPPANNPLLNSSSNHTFAAADNPATAAAATATAEVTAAEGEATPKRRKVEEEGKPAEKETAQAAAAAAKAALFGDYGDTSDCLFLLLQCPTLPGRFFPEKAKALGIAPGPIYAQLKGGERVQLGDGRWIDPAQVCSEPQEGKAFAFVECLQPQQAIKAAEYFKASEMRQLAAVFHMTAPEVANSPEYKALVEALSSPGTRHVPCNRSHSQRFSNPFLHAARLNHLLHILTPPLFPRRQEETAEEETSSVSKSPLPCPQEALVLVEPLAKLWLSPPTRALLDDCPKPPSELPLNFFETLFSPSALEELKASFACHLPPPRPQGSREAPQFDGPALKILGTGSAAPSHYRNVSASVLQLTPRLSVALDFGEGSLSQLRGTTQTEEEFLQLLLSLQFIFISHCHADHHLGLLPLLQCRAALWPEAKPPLVIAPARLQEWLAFANKEIAAMPHVFISCDSLVSTLAEPFSTEHLPPAAAACWAGEAAGLAIRTVEVDHIPDSFGVRIDYNDVSLVFSGDTRPCPQLFALASKCGALLHEATFEDALQVEALEKKHSCVSEVLRGAAECGCEHVILTHFSQRYPKIPHIPLVKRGHEGPEGEEAHGGEESPRKPAVLYAFDGLHLPLQHLALVAPCFRLLPAVIEHVFASLTETAPNNA